MLGVAWPQMRVALDAPLAGLGLLVAGTTVAYFASTASSGALATAIGTSRLAAIGAVVGACGLVLLAEIDGWPEAIVAVLLVGLGSGWIDAGLNTHVALVAGIRTMGLLHASWAIGAAIGPQLVVTSETLASSWRAAFLVAAIAFAAAAALLALVPPAPRFAPRREEAGGETARRSSRLTLGAAMFLLNVGLEASAGQWAFVDLTIARGLDPIAAGWGASLFWGALAAGRLALGIGGNRVPLELELDASVVLTLAGAAAYWFLPPPAAALLALPLLGLGLSVFLPVLLALVPRRLGPDATARAVGLQFAAGTVGGGAFPPAIGVAMQLVGAPVLGPAATLLAAALAALHAAARRD